MKKLFSSVCAFALGLSTACAQAVKTSPVWNPQGRLASPINVTNASSPTQLPSPGNVAWIVNTGAQDAFLAFGISNTISVTATTGTWLKAGKCAYYDLWPNGSNSGPLYSWVAAITASATTTLQVETGAGTPPNC